MAESLPKETKIPLAILYSKVRQGQIANISSSFVTEKGTVRTIVDKSQTITTSLSLIAKEIVSTLVEKDKSQTSTTSSGLVAEKEIVGTTTEKDKSQTITTQTFTKVMIDSPR